MKSMIFSMACLMGLALTNPAQGAGLNLTLSSEMAEIGMFTDELSLASNGGRISAGIIRSEEDDLLAHAGVMVLGIPTDDRIGRRLGLGIKAYAGDIDQTDDSAGALALGGLASMVFPSAYNPVELSVAAYYAPSVSTFADTDSLLEAWLRLTVEVVPQASAYIGARKLEIDTKDNGEVDIDKGIHFGVELRF